MKLGSNRVIIFLILGAFAKVSQGFVMYTQALLQRLKYVVVDSCALRCAQRGRRVRVNTDFLISWMIRLSLSVCVHAPLTLCH